MTDLPNADGVQTVQPGPPSPLHPGSVGPPLSADARDWDRPRLTVVERVYHQQIGSEPFAVESVFSRTLDSEEEHYQRTVKVNDGWTKLDCGWVSAASVLILRNEEGVFRHTNPTPEEEAEVALRVVELGLQIGAYVETTDEVRPQESIRRCPVDLSRLMVRCRHGAAKLRLTLIPR